MNKTLLGFVLGVVIIAGAVVGYVVYTAEEQPETAAQPDREAPTRVVPQRQPTPTPAKEAKKPEEPAEPTTPSTLTMRREPAGDANYARGGTVDVTITLEREGTEPIRAVGLQEQLPDGFMFDSLVRGERPDITPQPGTKDTLEFAWINVPEFPAKFTYRLKVAENADGAKQITGQTLYRTSGPELRTKEVASKFTPGAGADDETQVAQAEEAAGKGDNKGQEEAAEAKETAQEKEQAETQAAEQTKVAQAQPQETGANNPEAGGDSFVELGRSVEGGYTPAEPVEVTVNMQYTGAEPVLSLAVVEELPPGWAFGEVTGGDGPAIPPKQGQQGHVPFIWVQIPDFPASFTYTAVPPEGDSGKRTITGQVIYRTTGDEIRTPPVSTTLTSK